MTFSEFKELCDTNDPGNELPPLLHALLLEARGNWDKAHKIAQDDPSPDGSWVHAYLHRKEGDQYNASYWYRMAGRTKPAYGLEQEWKKIAQALL